MEDATRSYPANDEGLSFDISEVSERTFQLFIESEGLENRCNESPSIHAASDGIIRYCVKVDHSAFAISVIPVTCKDDKNEGGDQNSNYINQVQFLGFSPHIPDTLFISLLSEVIASLSSEHLILIKTQNDNLVEKLVLTGFVRISAIRDIVKQYAYLPRAHTPQSHATSPRVSRDIQLDANDTFYYNELSNLFDFSFVHLIREGWSVYSRNSRKFLFTLTFGRNKHLDQPAFRLDVFDCANGLYTAYNDVHIPEGSDSAFNDVPATGFSSTIPAPALECLENVDDVVAGKPEQIRNFWQNRDALWVHLENRHLGIAGSLERIACDIIKYLFPSVQNMQVCVHFENPGVYYFHKKNGASEIENGQYKLAYNIYGDERPLIKIVNHPMRNE